MTAPGGAVKVGEVYLEGYVEYNDRNTLGFVRSLESDLRRRVPDIGKVFNDAGLGFGKDLSRSMGTEIVKGVTTAAKDANASFQKEFGVGFGKEIPIKIDPQVDVTGLEEKISSGIKEGVSRAGRDDAHHISVGEVIGRLVAFGTRAGLHRQAQILRDAFIVIGAGAGAAMGVAVLAALQAAIVVGPPLVLSLAGLFIGAALGAGTLKLALTGVSEALEHVFNLSEEGSAKFEEALKGLSANAQTLMRELREEADFFKDFKDTIQDAFFSFNADTFVQNIKNLLKGLTDEAAAFADTMGNIMNRFVSWISMPKSVERLEQIFTGIDEIVKGIEPGLFHVLDALLIKGAEAAEYAEDFAKWLNEILHGLADWVEKNSLKEMFEKAKPAIEDIKRIWESIKSIISNIMGPDIFSGGGPLELFADIMEALDKVSGRIRDLVEKIKALPDEVQDALGLVGLAFLAAIPATALISAAANVTKPILALKEVFVALGLSSTAAGLLLIGLGLGITALGLIFFTAYTRSEEFRAKIKEAGDQVRQTWEEDIRPSLQELTKQFEETLKAAEDLAKELGAYEGLGELVKIAAQNLSLFVLGLSETIKVILKIIEVDLDLTTEKIRLLKDALKDLEGVGGLGLTFEVVAEGGWKQEIEDVNRTFDELRIEINEDLESIKVKWRETVTTFREEAEIWKGIWRDIQGAVDTVVGWWEVIVLPKIIFILAEIQRYIDLLKVGWNTAWGEIKQTFLDNVTSVEVRAEEFKNTIVRIFTALRDAIAGLWNDILSVAIEKINAIGRVINALIKAVNAIPSVDIPELPNGGNVLAEGGAIAPATGFSGAAFMAKGGAIFGGPAGTDTVQAMSKTQRYFLNNGEHVFTKEEVGIMGGQAAVYAFRDWLKQGKGSEATPRGRSDVLFMGGPQMMVGGGRVGGGNDGLLQEHRDHVHVAMSGPPMSFPQIIAHAIRSGISHSVGSTFRPGSRGSGGGLDHHSQGKAVDFPGFNQDRLASFFEGLGGVIELIHRTNTRDYAIFGGGGGGSSVLSWIMTALGKAARAALEKAIGALKGLLPEGDGVVDTSIRALGNAVADGALRFFDEKAGAASGGGPAGGPPTGPIQEYARNALKNLGWPDSEWGALQRLWEGESNWNPNAVNPSSGAYGIPQILPSAHGRPVALGDYQNQINWGLNYIKARYGTPTKALNFWLAQNPHWYEEGGTVMDQGGGMHAGRNVLDNFTGRPEAILSPEHSQFVGRVLSGENLIIENHLYVDGEPIRVISREEIRVRDNDFVTGLQSGRSS